MTTTKGAVDVGLAMRAARSAAHRAAGLVGTVLATWIGVWASRTVFADAVFLGSDIDLSMWVMFAALVTGSFSFVLSVIDLAGIFTARREIGDTFSEGRDIARARLRDLDTTMRLHRHDREMDLALDPELRREWGRVSEEEGSE